MEGSADDNQRRTAAYGVSDRTVAAVAAAIPAGEGVVEVAGEGVLAHELRAWFGTGPAAARDERPSVVVEATGDPEAIIAALEHVADLGTVVLAGPLAGVPVALDLYADLHVRGLTIVGVPPPSDDAI